jgi:hypothetical protein
LGRRGAGGGGDSDTVSVIDLKAAPPRGVETVTVGQTPEGIVLSPDGKLCAVQVMNGSNKSKESPFRAPNGKLILYRVDGTRLLAAAWIGQWSQGMPLRRQQDDPGAKYGRRRFRCCAGTACSRTAGRASRPAGPAAIASPRLAGGCIRQGALIRAAGRRAAAPRPSA